MKTFQIKSGFLNEQSLRTLRGKKPQSSHEYYESQKTNPSPEWINVTPKEAEKLGLR